MEQTTLDTIKAQLTAEKTKLEKELSGFTQKDAVIDDNYTTNFPKFGDTEEENAAEVTAYSDQLSIEHALEKQLRDVNKALVSIEDGSYGTCKHCGEPINEQRLIARPTSTSCIECKKKLTGEA